MKKNRKAAKTGHIVNNSKLFVPSPTHGSLFFEGVKKTATAPLTTLVSLKKKQTDRSEQEDGQPSGNSFAYWTPHSVAKQLQRPCCQ